MGDLSNEPSMEEILSSIKRIIAEDSDAALAPPRGRRATALSAAAERAQAGAPAEEAEILELTEAAPAEPASAADATQMEVQPAMADAPPAKPLLVSDATLSASRSSIAALAALVVKPEVTGSDTLEGLVREMLKPMLAQWLDERLPDVVERLVAQEIARITARG